MDGNCLKYFSIEGYKSIVTKDGWNSFEIIKNSEFNKNDYEEERDSGIKVKVSFTLEYGKDISDLVFNEFNKIADKCSTKTMPDVIKIENSKKELIELGISPVLT